MLPLAGQTAGPNGLKFFVDTHGCLFSMHLKILNYNINIYVIFKQLHIKLKNFDDWLSELIFYQ